jgi:hypothetical protein
MVERKEPQIPYDQWRTANAADEEELQNTRIRRQEEKEEAAIERAQEEYQERRMNR